MPRIAAALGLVATVAFCIGFNVNRYPRVWEMVTPTRVSGGTPAVAAAAPVANEAKSAATEGKPAHKDKKPAQRTPVASISAKEATEKQKARHDYDESPTKSDDGQRSVDEAERPLGYAPIDPIPIDRTPAPAKAFAPIPSPTVSADRQSSHAAAAKKEGGAQDKSEKGRMDGDKPHKRPEQKKAQAGNGGRNKRPSESTVAPSPLSLSREGERGSKAADVAKSKAAQAKRSADGEKKSAAMVKIDAERTFGEKPMVPIVVDQTAEREAADPFTGGSAYDAAGSLKRLPPVDPYQPAMSDPYAAVSPDGAEPAYPTTGARTE